MNYVHLQVIMRNDADYTSFSDAWAVPTALRGKLPVDVTPEDEDEFGIGIPVRVITLSGKVDSETLAALRDEWGIDPERAEPAMGFLGDLGDGVPRLYDDERHNFEPMDWNMGGVTPVLDATLSIVGDDAHPA